MVSGEVFLIQEISGPDVLVERLHEIGFFRGLSIVFRGRGPFSGPFIVQLKTVTMSLREEEWNCLKVKKITTKESENQVINQKHLDSKVCANSEK